MLIISIMTFFGLELFEKQTNKSEFYEGDGYSYFKSVRREGWELWIYSTDKPDTDNITFNQRDLSSREQCMTEGLARTRERGSYQCGYNCYSIKSEFKDIRPATVDVCEIVCETNGCRK